MTFGTFSWLKDWQITDINRCYYPGDTVRGLFLSRALDDISLVEDTTQPMINLAHFSLGNDTVLCPGSSLTLGGEPYFFHYWWDNGDTTRFRTITQPGTYWCTVDYGCNTYTDTIRVLPPPLLPQNLFGDTAACFPTTLSLRLPRRYPVQQWSTGSTADSIAITAPGLYWVRVGDGCGLFFRDTFRVTNSYVGLPSFSLPDTTLCNPAGITVRVPFPADKYRWSTGDTTASIQITQPGAYWLRLTNSCGATVSDTFRVLPPPPPFTLGPDTLLCGPAPGITLSVPAGYGPIRWSTGETGSSIFVAATGVYWVEAQSPCGPVRDTVAITVCPPEIEAISFQPDTLCEGDCTIISAQVRNKATRSEWTFTGGQPATFSGITPPPVCYPVAGIYPVRLIVSNATNSDTAYAQTVVLPQPQRRFADTGIVAHYGSLLSLPACAGGAHINWYAADGTLLCAGCPTLPLEAKVFQSRYTCVVRNTEACADSCTYSVRVTDIPTDLWLPSAFTPNGDGTNDRFAVISTNPNVRIEQFRIFNRFGELVYSESGLVGSGWDGTFKGQTQPVGTFYWLLKYHVEGTSGEFFLKGDVNLLR